MRFSSFTYLVGQGLHNMRANRLMTLASMGVLTVCMILVGAAYLLGVNVDAVVGYIGSQNESYVIINDEATDEQVTALGDQIAAVAEAYGSEAADGTHLHFEMTLNGEQTDPAEYLDPVYSEK